MFSFFCAVFFVFVKYRVIAAPAAATAVMIVAVVVHDVEGGFGAVSSSLAMVKLIVSDAAVLPAVSVA